MRHILSPVLLMFFGISTLVQSANASPNDGCRWTNEGHVLCSGVAHERTSARAHRRAAVKREAVSKQAAIPLPRSRPGLAAHVASSADGNGVVVSRKTGARARVSPRYSSRFQAYVDDLEQNYGARVLFMGGYRAGVCSSSSEHPCGKALDVCQLRRGVVDHRCRLPSRIVLAAVAARHDLFEGGRWCHSDMGHAQVDVTAHACRHNLYAAVTAFKERRPQ